VVGAALLMAAGVLYAVAPESVSRWGAFPAGSWLAAGAGMLVLFGAFAGPRR